MCDNQGSTLTLIKTKTGHIFGGYSSISWDSDGGFRRDEKAYLFSLYEPGGRRPLACHIRPGDEKLRAVYHGRRYGPIFGRQDLTINMDHPGKSSSRLGFAYTMPEKVHKGKPDTLMAG